MDPTALFYCPDCNGVDALTHNGWGEETIRDMEGNWESGESLTLALPPPPTPFTISAPCSPSPWVIFQDMGQNELHQQRLHIVQFQGLAQILKHAFTVGVFNHLLFLRNYQK